MYQLGKENPEVPNKVILVMGARGSKLEAVSEVTAYVVNHQKGFRIPYSLTIIDMPGFEGTRDAEGDKLVEEQLLEFFSTPGGIDHMDAICLVAQAFLAHSTHTQKHIFDSMLSMLGKDVLETKSLTLTLEVLKERQELEAALRRPAPPKVEQVHPNSFQISIDPVAIGKPSVSRFQVEYRIAGDNWKSLSTEGPKDQFTLEDVHLNLQYQFRSAQRDFGLKAKDYTIILFAHYSNIGSRSLRNVKYLQYENMDEYIAECGNRCLAFNNKAKGVEREAQVAELMTMIDDLVERNSDAPCYTEDMMNIN
ncbi:hypothetical protein E2320_004379 [Naja naja]|nr:hypothetical protein E2320_004379 [Naja naja]